MLRGSRMPNEIIGWHYLGSGEYNDAYTDKELTKVLKIVKPSIHLKTLDTPERSVRVWNSINKGFGSPAYVTTVWSLSSQKKTKLYGWVCPYVHGEQSNDDEIQKALIKIFNRTGRIITDAVTPNNFKTTPKGEVVAVDIGFALDLNKTNKQKSRRASMISREAWRRLKDNYTPYFNHPDSQRDFPKSLKTIKALLVIKNTRPDILNVDFLLEEPHFLQRLADSYNNAWNIPNIEDELSDKRPINLNGIKESCIGILKRYIQSRGDLMYDDSFSPNFLTAYFRNRELTKQKIVEVNHLIKHIDEASTLNDIESLISNAKIADERRKGFFGGLTESLVACEKVLGLDFKHFNVRLLPRNP